MRKKALKKDIIKEIVKSKKRFISIILIVMLGVGFYAGIKASTPAMQYTANKYLNNLNLMDFKLVSTYGVTKSNVEKISKLKGIEAIMPTYTKSIIAKKSENSKEEIVLNVSTLDLNRDKEENTYINRLDIVEGRLPENDNEIVIDERVKERKKYSVNQKIYLLDQEYLKQKEYTIVGIVNSPLYISIERGTTNLSSGDIAGFAYISQNNIKQELYSEIYVTVKNVKNENSFSEA